MPITKPNPASGGGSVPGKVLNDDTTLMLPTVTEYLRDDQYADGSARRTATLLVFFEAGWWKACLNDRQECCTAWSAGSTPSECLMQLEEALATGRVEWRRVAGKPKPR